MADYDITIGVHYTVRVTDASNVNDAIETAMKGDPVVEGERLGVPYFLDATRVNIDGD